MSLFQKSVEKKYLNDLDTDLIYSKFNQFQEFFDDPVRQENIRNSKEEQFQEGFLRELFVKILGYTLNPEPNFNLTTELKNTDNSKKADGAILLNNKAIAVIELKSTNTTDLDSIETQAFGYKNHNPGCKYVITSNFEKLRFYIQNAVDHIDFNLFNLSKEQFSLLWLCLHKDNLLSDLPQKIKSASVLKEEDISKKLYADYSKFRQAIYNNLVKNNPDIDKLLLFKKTQKLLDRFLFIFFAEDRQLVPANSISQIIDKWNDDNDFGDDKALYDIFKQYFNVLYKGRPKRGNREEIFAYNGGLFAPDELLDNLIIDDEVLNEHTLKLSGYNFDPEQQNEKQNEEVVDVNILGHIFEHSLGEIENVQAEIKGEKVDSQKTKRKKDGIFYTPKYITKYIVENTVGKLCDEKKAELEIQPDVTFERKKDGKLTKKAKDYYTRLEQYRQWLLTLTILDPACGSGAFLNQALDFLLSEHEFITVQMQNITGDLATLFVDVEKHILENNIYGVDLNDESVEIAKLSLWLRTAQKGRKLNALNNNIKCGNSLIDDPEVAGEKAFNWQAEFPHVFEKGGFDVVIGNPPYVQLQSMGEMSNSLAKCGYETFHKGADLYCLFTERGYKLLKQGGMQSFIMPNKWMLVAYGKPLRKFLSQTGLRQILNFGDIQFFQEATTYVCIFVVQNAIPTENVKVLSLNKNTYHNDFISEVATGLYDYPTTKFGENEWSIQPQQDAIKLAQMEKGSTKLKDLPISIYRGILTGYNDAFFINEETKQQLIAKDPKSEELIKPMLKGRDIIAYGYSEHEFLINTHNGVKDKTNPIPPININEFSAVKEHLDNFYPKLEKRGDKGVTPYNLRNCAYLLEFYKPKIIYPNMTSVFPFMYDESGILGNQKCFILTARDETISLPFLTALLNSSLAKLWIWYNCPELQGGTREISKVYFQNFPIPNASYEQISTLAHSTTVQTKLTADFQSLSSKFQRTLQRKFELPTLPKKLQEWYTLSFTDFIKELRKKKIKLALSEEADWEDYFLTEQQKAKSLKTEMTKTDNEIDQMVYQLYGLTYEEIKIVEESIN